MIKLKNKSHSKKLTKKKELESNLKEEKNEEWWNWKKIKNNLKEK